MKKKKFVPILIGVVAISISIFAENNDKKELSDLTMENVEALTSGENGTKDCVLSLTHICTSGHTDHQGYKREP